MPLNEFSEGSATVLNDETEESRFGELLAPGLIVKFNSPSVDFDEALKGGRDNMMNFFDNVIAGLREKHVDNLRNLGLFSEIESRTGLNVDIGSWEEISGENLVKLIEIVEKIVDREHLTSGILTDLHEMAQQARQEGCSIAFMLG